MITSSGPVSYLPLFFIMNDLPDVNKNMERMNAPLPYRTVDSESSGSDKALQALGL